MRRIILAIILAMFVYPQIVFGDGFSNIKIAENAFSAVRDKNFSAFAKNDGYIKYQLTLIDQQSLKIEKQEKIDSAMAAWQNGFDSAIRNINISDWNHRGYVVNRIVFQIASIYPAGANMHFVETTKGSPRQMVLKIVYGGLKPWLIVDKEKNLGTIHINDEKADKLIQAEGRGYLFKIKAKEIYITTIIDDYFSGGENVCGVLWGICIKGDKYSAGGHGVKWIPGIWY